MANMISTLRQRAATTAADTRLVSSIQFDWAATALGGALVGGVYLDGWAHEHGRVDDSFFTPWHGVMYGAMFLVGVFLVLTLSANMLRGYAWRRALPVGYGLSLVGVLLFAVGGVGDLIWHTLFGIEADLEALLSPTHLILALGWLLIVGGPFRAAWQRIVDSKANGVSRWPAVLSLTWTLSVFTFFTIYATPFGHALAANGAPTGETTTALGIVGFLLQPALLMGVILLALRRWRLPFGSVTLVLTINTALVAVLHDMYPFIGVAALAGLVADLLLRWWQPSVDRPGSVRAFAFAVPFVLYALYFGTLLFTSGIGWTVHLWTGAIVLAGVIGLLVSYAVVPPVIPADAAARPQRR